MTSSSPDGLDIDQALEAARAERGAQALVRLGDPNRDDPRVQPVLAEVQPYLGVSFTSPIFVALAHWPEFLARAWQGYRPLIDTARYRSAVAALRVPADVLVRSGAAGLPRPGADDDGDALLQYLRLQQRLLPELLLLASAWYRGACGYGGAEQAAPAPPAPRGVPAGLPALSPATDPSPELAQVYQRLKELHGHPRVLSVYQVIGRWPQVLTAAAPVLYERIEGPAYATARDRLLDDAIRAAAEVGMPAVDTGDGDGPAEILALFRTRLIPALLLDSAILLSLLDDHSTGNGAN